MARYCDAKDLRALVPDSFRDAALADSAGGDEADAGLLSAVLEAACDETDALVEGRVRLPLAAVPRKLRVAAAYIALELLFLRRALRLPDLLAEKIAWWRNWLSKVGEGELRLEAPAPDSAPAGRSSSVAVRPSVTGSHGLIFGLALAFLLSALVPAETCRAVEARSWAFNLPAAADVFDNPAEIEWAAGESLALSYAGGTLAEGQTARWEVASGTNLWLALDLDAAGSRWTWTLAPTQTCLPTGRYAGRIAVYETDGTEATFARVAALQSIRVHQGAAGLATANPLAVLSDYALRSWAEAQHTAIARDIATNAAAIADLEAAASATAAGVATNAAAIADLQGALGTNVTALLADIEGLRAATNSLSLRADSAAAMHAAATNALSGRIDTNAAAILALQSASDALSTRSGRLEAATNSLAARVADGEAAVAALRSATNALAGRMGTNESAVAALQSATNDLSGRVHTNEQAIAALQALSGSVGTNTSALADLQANAATAAALAAASNSLSARIGTNETAIADLRGTDSDLDGRVDALETYRTALEYDTIPAIGSHLNTLDNATNALRLATNNLNGRLLSAEDNLADLNTSEIAFSGRFGTNEAAIAALQSATNNLRGRVNTNALAIVNLQTADATHASGISSNAAAIDALRAATQHLAEVSASAADLENYVPYYTTSSNTLRAAAWHFAGPNGIYGPRIPVSFSWAALYLNGYGISNWTDIVQGYARTADLQSWVSSYLATNHQDLSAYATTNWVTNHAGSLSGIADLQSGLSALSGTVDGLAADVAALPTGFVAVSNAAGTNATISRGWTFRNGYPGAYPQRQRFAFETAMLDLNGRAITNWTDIVKGYASTNWVSGRGFLTAHQSLDGYATTAWVTNHLAGRGYLTNHQSLASYATRSWVTNQIGSLSNFLAGLSVEDGTNSFSLEGLSTALADLRDATNTLDTAATGNSSAITELQSATNALDTAVTSNASAIAALNTWTNGIGEIISAHAGSGGSGTSTNAVEKTGDTMTGTLAVPSLAAGFQVTPAAAGSIAAGNHATAGSPWAFVWNGDDGIDALTAAQLVEYEATEGTTFYTDSHVPRYRTLAGFFGTDSETWAPLETVTFVGWKAATGNPETFYFDDGEWKDVDENADWSDEDVLPQIFLCPMEFTTKGTYDTETTYAWEAEMRPAVLYTAHGTGTFNVNPAGGLEGFYVGETNLDRILSWRETLFGLSLIPKYVDQAGDTMSGPLEIRMRNANWVSNASPLLVVGNTNRTGNHATVDVRNLRFEITTNNNLLLGRRKSGLLDEGVMADDGVINSVGIGRFANVRHSDAFVWSARESPETRQGDGMGWPGTGPYSMTMGRGTVAFWPADPTRPEDQFYVGRNNLRQTISNNAVTAIFFKDYITGNYSEESFNGRFGLDVGDGLRIKDFETNNIHVLKISLQSWLVGALQGLGIDIDDEGGDDPGSGMPPTRWVAGSNVTFRVDTNAFTDTYIDADPGVATLNGLKGAVTILDYWGTPLGTSSDSNAILLDDPLPTEVRDFFTANLLVPVYEVESNAIRIVDFALGDFGTANACITYVGNPTNGTVRLESRPDATNDWTTWNNCWFSTAYYGIDELDACYIVDASAGTHYRLVAEGGIPDRTNAALLASAPIYLGTAFDASSRLATMADVERAIANGASAAKTPMVTRRAYKDPMNVAPSNGLAWNFSNDGVYIADLSVGGWTEETSTVTTNEGTVTTNTVTVTNVGTMTLNGQTISSWAELATYADGVEFTVETGVESVNGLDGAVTLAAGEGVSLALDDSTGTVTISASGGGGGGGGGGGAWTPGSALYTTNDWTMPANANAYAAFGMNTSATNLTLTLSAQSAYQTIVVRKFGAANELNIIGTTTNTLYYDGEVLVLDYWPADAGTEWAGGWYWRRQ